MLFFEIYIKVSLVIKMSTREHHYARIREALTDALSKIDIPTDDDDDDDDDVEKKRTCAIPTPFVEFQDQFPDELYPEVRIELAIGAGMMLNKTTGGGGGVVAGAKSCSWRVRRIVSTLREAQTFGPLNAILTKQLSRFMPTSGAVFDRTKEAIHDEFDLSF